jgi:hypothetical protein
LDHPSDDGSGGRLDGTPVVVGGVEVGGTLVVVVAVVETVVLDGAIVLDGAVGTGGLTGAIAPYVLDVLQPAPDAELKAVGVPVAAREVTGVRSSLPASWAGAGPAAEAGGLGRLGWVPKPRPWPRLDAASPTAIGAWRMPSRTGFGSWVTNQPSRLNAATRNIPPIPPAIRKFGIRRAPQS